MGTADSHWVNRSSRHEGMKTEVPPAGGKLKKRKKKKWSLLKVRGLFFSASRRLHLTSCADSIFSGRGTQRREGRAV